MKKSSALLLLGIAFLAGCVSSDSSAKFYADPIQIDDSTYVISPSDPFSGGITTIQFAVTNLGRAVANDIEISLFDLAGFKPLSIECQKAESGQNKCTISQLENLFKSNVKIVLQAPVVGSVSPTSITISYSLKYPYTSYREEIIPIVDDVSVTRPQNPYVSSSQSDGPITLEIEPPKGGERTEGKNKIIDRWIRKDIPFEMKFSLKNVGSKSFGEPQPVTIKPGDLQIKLVGLKVAEVAGVNLPCDLDYSGDVLVSKTPFIVYPNEPTKFSCNLVSSEEFDGYQNSQMSASFSYIYQIIRKEVLSVKPRT